MPRGIWKNPSGHAKFRKDARNNQIIEARTVEGRTMQEIADRFGISRERVRQVLENCNGGSGGRRFVSTFGSEFYTDEQLSRMTKDDLDYLHDHEGLHGVTSLKKRMANIHHPPSGDTKVASALRRIWEAEVEVSERLTKLGIVHTVLPMHPKGRKRPYSIVTENGVTILVRAAGSPQKPFGPDGSNRRHHYHFAIARKKPRADFYVLVLTYPGIFFVVPKEVVGNASSDILFCYPPAAHGKHSKYLEFADRWDLLAPAS